MLCIKMDQTILTLSFMSKICFLKYKLKVFANIMYFMPKSIWPIKLIIWTPMLNPLRYHIAQESNLIIFINFFKWESTTNDSQVTRSNFSNKIILPKAWNCLKRLIFVRPHVLNFNYAMVITYFICSTIWIN